MRWVVAIVAIWAIGIATPIPASATQQRSVALGVLGNADRFRGQTGQASTVRHVIVGWGQGMTWGTRLPVLLEGLRPVPLLGIGTGPTGTRGVITPLQIAMGKGDDYLLAVNGALAGFASLAYLRPLPEMNNHHRPFSAFDESGRPRGADYSTAAFRQAFARIYLIAHGGPAARIDARLRRLGLPPLGRDLPEPEVEVVWNPQGFGSPDIPANAAQAYYPGDAYVDVVANDLYDQNFNAAWEAHERLYDAHPGKPFGIAEWGLWSVDDPAFVERMAAFVKSHPRVVFLAYFSGRPGSPWDLATKPRSRDAYRRLITPLG